MENKLQTQDPLWNAQLKTAFTESYQVFFLRAKRFIKANDDAADVVMDVFLKLLSRPATTYNLIGYIVNTVDFLAKDFVRRKKPVLTDDIARAGRRLTSNDALFEDSQYLEVLLVKAKLTGDQHLLLSFIQQGYDNAEIAQALGKEADEIRKKRFSLLRKLNTTALTLDPGLRE